MESRYDLVILALDHPSSLWIRRILGQSSRQSSCVITISASSCNAFGYGISSIDQTPYLATIAWDAEASLKPIAIAVAVTDDSLRGPFLTCVEWLLSKISTANDHSEKCAPNGVKHDFGGG